MSLINDALKRAKAAQATAPQADDTIPHLRPVESGSSSFNGSGLVLPVVLTMVALGGLFFLWHAAPGDTRAANATPPAPEVTAGATRSSAAPAVAETQGRSEAAPHPAMATTAPAVAPMQTNAQVATAVTQVGATGGATNLAQPVTPVVAKPGPPRLQAIFYSPSRPSAMIGGKTVFVGERVQGFQVAAITRDSATLVGAGSTNLLSLER